MGLWGGFAESSRDYDNVSGDANVNCSGSGSISSSGSDKKDVGDSDCGSDCGSNCGSCSSSMGEYENRCRNGSDYESSELEIENALRRKKQ